MLTLSPRRIIFIIALSASIAGAAARPPEMAIEDVTVALQGVQVETAADGTWSRIYATGTQAVDFPDARGVAKARTIAEERAKGQLVRFLEQQVSVETVAAELEQTTSATARVQGTGSDTFSKEARRTLSSSLTEVMRSYASGTLRGITVLESGYSKEREEAWVQVGFSRSSLTAAQSAKADLKRDRALSSPAGSSGSVGPLPITQPPSEIKKAPTPSQVYRSFTAARGFVRSLGLANQPEWEVYLKSGDKPADIPDNPALAYKGQWVSWGNWLGIVPPK